MPRGMSESGTRPLSQNSDYSSESNPNLELGGRSFPDGSYLGDIFHSPLNGDCRIIAKPSETSWFTEVRSLSSAGAILSWKVASIKLQISLNSLVPSISSQSTEFMSSIGRRTSFGALKILDKRASIPNSDFGSLMTICLPVASVLSGCGPDGPLRPHHTGALVG